MNITLVLTILALLSTRAIAQDKTLTDYGVEISFSGDKDIFPESWLTKEIDAKAISLDSAEIERSKRIITKALNAGNLFLSSKGFWEIGESRKRIKKKTDQAIQFYSLMDKSFNEAYFRQVSKK